MNLDRLCAITLKAAGRITYKLRVVVRSNQKLGSPVRSLDANSVFLPVRPRDLLSVPSEEREFIMPASTQFILGSDWLQGAQY